MSVENQLIELVKKHPVLYKRSRGYNNKSAKIKTWNKIAKILSLTDKVCQIKWKSLRDRFCKEYKKHSMVTERNATLASWEHWSSMIFLKDHIQLKNNNVCPEADNTNESVISRSKSGEQEMKIDTDIDMTDFLNFKDPLESSSPKQKLIALAENITVPNANIRIELLDTMKFFNSYLSRKTTIAPVQSSQTKTFCKVIGDIIESLQPNNQIAAKSQILKLLSDIQLQEINNT